MEKLPPLETSKPFSDREPLKGAFPPTLMPVIPVLPLALPLTLSRPFGESSHSAQNPPGGALPREGNTRRFPIGPREGEAHSGLAG